MRGKSETLPVLNFKIFRLFTTYAPSELKGSLASQAVGLCRPSRLVYHGELLVRGS